MKQYDENNIYHILYDKKSASRLLSSNVYNFAKKIGCIHLSAFEPVTQEEADKICICTIVENNDRYVLNEGNPLVKDFFSRYSKEEIINRFSIVKTDKGLTWKISEKYHIQESLFKEKPLFIESIPKIQIKKFIGRNGRVNMIKLQKFINDTVAKQVEIAVGKIVDKIELNSGPIIIKQEPKKEENLTKEVLQELVPVPKKKKPRVKINVENEYTMNRREEFTRLLEQPFIIFGNRKIIRKQEFSLKILQLLGFKVSSDKRANNSNFIGAFRRFFGSDKKVMEAFKKYYMTGMQDNPKGLYSISISPLLITQLARECRYYVDRKKNELRKAG